LTALLYLLAFLSGFAALVYQVAWSRMLALTFGSSTLAVSAVVAGFMGGMGIGAWLYHRVGGAGDRAESPLRSYGFLEIVIGIATAAFTLLFVPLPQWFAALSQVLPSGVFMDLTRAVLVFILLVIPAALMGATYPALCQVLLRDAADVKNRLGWIYGLNTLGAACGALAAGFLMVEVFGSRGSVHVANAINVGVGVVALFLSRRWQASASGPSASPSLDQLRTSLPVWIAGIVLFGSGFATLGYEIVWFRALHYVMGSGTYVLSTALVIFLVGLGVGGTIYRPMIEWGKAEENLGFAQLLIALLAVAAIGAEHWMLTSLAFSSEYGPFSTALMFAPWWSRIAIGFGISVAIMLPATLCMGIVFPLASRLFLGSAADGVEASVRGEAERFSARLGFAYLLSNLGSILGATAAAIWILPALGTVGGTQFIVYVNLLLALLILVRVCRGMKRLVCVAAAGAIAAMSMLLPPRLAFENPNTTQRPGGVVRLFEEESDRGTVQVFAAATDPSARSISIDGVMVGVTQTWSPGLHSKQTLLAHLPMSLDRRIEHTLNLGLASSSTLRTLAQYDWVETLDAVEINPAVLEGTSYFDDSEVLTDPRAEIHVEDAVHYLLRTPNAYDLIISDAKQDPRFAGNSKILSSEFYAYSLSSLKECGLFVQFLSLAYAPEYLSLILRTFDQAFEEAELFVDPPGFIVMVGSRCPIAGRARPTEDELDRIGVREEIAKHFVPTIDALPALWMASGREMRGHVGEGAVNSWDKLPLEFLSYRMELSTRSTPLPNLELLAAPRDLPGASGPTAFTSLPHFESLQALHRAWIQWMQGDEVGARRAVNAIKKNDRRNPIVRKAVREMRYRDQL
jgi:spermidine synthase